MLIPLILSFKTAGLYIVKKSTSKLIDKNNIVVIKIGSNLDLFMYLKIIEKVISIAIKNEISSLKALIKKESKYIKAVIYNIIWEFPNVCLLLSRMIK